MEKQAEGEGERAGVTDRMSEIAEYTTGADFTRWKQ